MPNKKKEDSFDMDAGVLSRFQQVVEKLGERGKAAEIAGISRDALQRSFYGKTSPKFETVRKLCEAAQISLDWVATGKITPINHHDDSCKTPTTNGFIYQINQKAKIGDVAYLQRKDGKGVLGLIKKETKDNLEITLLDEVSLNVSENQEIVTFKKSELSIVAPAQIIRSLN